MQFYGNKVVALGREKDTAWYEAYIELVTSTVNFIVARAENICDWTGRNDGAEAFYNSIAEKIMSGDFAVSVPGSVASSAPTGQATTKP